MFTDEEAKGAEGAKDEQQEGREELIVKDFVSNVKSESENKQLEGREELIMKDFVGDMKSES